MKKQYIRLSWLLGLAVVFISCSRSFLEVTPAGKLIPGEVADYDLMMNNMNYYYAGTAGLQEAVLMGDELDAEGKYFNNVSVYNTRLFGWQDSVYQLSDIPYFIKSSLEQFYTLNKVIEEVMTASGGTDTDKRRILAEARATRAWTNFILVNYYAKPYAVATAATDPGFPIIDKPDITIEEYNRGTVQQMYDFIIADLTAAIADLPQRPVTVSRMSKPAASGLLGKVYLFMGRYADALPYLNASMEGVTANGAPSLYNYNETLAPGGIFQPIDSLSSMKGPVNGPGNQPNDLKEAVVSKVFSNSLFGGNMFGTDGLVLSPATAALYGTHDLRLLLYSTRNQDGSRNTAGRLRKYGVSFSRMGLQLPDLILLKAETEARTGALSAAVSTLESLRRNRMPVADATVPTAIAASQPALVKFIIDERTREFAGEGYRWFDMRRLSTDPLFAGSSFTHTLYNTDGTATVFTLRPQRLVMMIPSAIAITNPGMENNP